MAIDIGKRHNVLSVGFVTICNHCYRLLWFIILLQKIYGTATANKKNEMGLFKCLKDDDLKAFRDYNINK